MPKTDRLRFSIVILLTIIMAIMVFYTKRFPPIENRKLFTFPLVIGAWTGVDVPMSDYVYRGIETPYLFMRNYTRPGVTSQINLAVVWFDDTNIAFHTPEKCLGGVGDEVLEKTSVTVVLDKEYHLTKDIIELDNIRHLVLYFFDADGFITSSQAAVRLRVLEKRLLFQRASASFVRIMTPIEKSEQDSMVLMMDFLKTFQPLIPYYTYTDMILDQHTH